ncbi:predicted protein, partial [Nematostella vectensis]
MSGEDILYLLILILSIPYGYFVKISGSPARKQFLSTLAGVGLSLALLGPWGIWHSLTAVIGAYLIVASLGPRRCQWVAFLFVFGYLFFFRTCTYFGFKKPPMQSNAVQLLVTLRLCTLPFEIFDPEISRNKAAATSKPSFYEFLSYSYCYCGLLTGPYYRYKTYKDFLEQENPEKIASLWPALRRLKFAPLYGGLYLLMNTYFPTKHLMSEEFFKHPWGIPYQLLYLVPAFNGFRWRFYIGWLLAESSCIMLGLGAYPFETDPKPALGPSKPMPAENGHVSEVADTKENGDTHSFMTVYNIDIFKVEFAPSMRSIMKDWNMSVQWWIAQYVHRKLPFSNRNIRMSVTLLVSAFWHGVAPGYYLTFLSVPLVVMAEVRMEKAIKPWLSQRMCYYYDWCSWFCLYRAMEYLGCGFILLQFAPCIAIWKNMYFIGHIIMVLFII